MRGWAGRGQRCCLVAICARGRPRARPTRCCFVRSASRKPREHTSPRTLHTLFTALALPRPRHRQLQARTTSRSSHPALPVLTCPQVDLSDSPLIAPRAPGRGAHVLGRPFPLCRRRTDARNALQHPPPAQRRCILYVSVTVLYLTQNRVSRPACLPRRSCFLGIARCCCSAPASVLSTSTTIALFSLVVSLLGSGYGQRVFISIRLCLCNQCCP